MQKHRTRHGSRGVKHLCIHSENTQDSHVLGERSLPTTQKFYIYLYFFFASFWGNSCYKPDAVTPAGRPDREPSRPVISVGCLYGPLNHKQGHRSEEGKLHSKIIQKSQKKNRNFFLAPSAKGINLKGFFRIRNAWLNSSKKLAPPLSIGRARHCSSAPLK